MINEAILTFRVSSEEKELIEKYAKFEWKSISDYIRNLFYERIEDVEDQKSIKDYEKNKDNEEFIPFDEAMKELGYE